MMKKKNNKEEENKKRLCEDARKIQDILAKGNYTIRKWLGGTQKKPTYNYYLVSNGKQPWEGVYICRADD